MGKPWRQDQNAGRSNVVEEVSCQATATSGKRGNGKKECSRSFSLNFTCSSCSRMCVTTRRGIKCFSLESETVKAEGPFKFEKSCASMFSTRKLVGDLHCKTDGLLERTLTRLTKDDYQTNREGD